MLLGRKLKPLYEARFTAEQRNRIEQLAHDAYAYAETKFAGQGAAKFHGATKYLSDRLGSVGIKIGNDEIESAVQLAWEKFNPGKTQTNRYGISIPRRFSKGGCFHFCG
ncbi:phage holin, LLH family [Paenibacillus terrae]|uniref:phage holin, LLH family n=1 Tax=Paenibacillus terrae TaxID=159743 RepID=UPI0009E4A898